MKRNLLLLISLKFVIFSGTSVYAQSVDFSNQTLENIIKVEMPDVSDSQQINPINKECIGNKAINGRFSFTKIDSLLSQQMQKVLDDALVNYGIKGLSAALSTKEGDIWTGVSGISHDTLQIKPEMLFGIGSQTKNFIAALILQLYEEGQINLSDSIYHWLPVFENIDTNITIKQLLNHTSGVYNWINHPGVGDSVWIAGSRIWTPEEILSYFILDSLFPAGTDFSYSNSNYLLLGLIIEAVTGNEVVEELHARLLDTLGLNATFLFPDEFFSGTRSHVWGPYGGPLIDYTDIIDTVFLSACWSGGAILSTAEDLVKWSKGLYHGGILNPSTINLMTTPTPIVGGTIYGLGTQIWGSGEFVGHSGDVGYTSATVYNPDDSLSIAVLSNTQSYAIDDIWQTLYYTYLNFTTSVSQTAPNIQFSLYPNPCRDLLNIYHNLEDAGNIECKVINIQGEVLFNTNYSNAGNGERDLTINMTGYPAGLYFILINTSHEIITKKVIKL